MRILGPNATLTDFRLDLVHLAARLRADRRAELNALAARVDAQKDLLLEDRAAIESAEDQLTAAYAVVSARDADLDDEERRFALAAKLAGAGDALFPVAPHKLVSAPIDTEIQHVRNQLAKLAARPADDALRTTWEPAISAALAAVVAAKEARSAEQSDISVARARIAERKQGTDAFRVEIWGVINSILKDKEASDAFFRSKPAGGKKKDEPAPEA